MSYYHVIRCVSCADRLGVQVGHHLVALDVGAVQTRCDVTQPILERRTYPHGEKLPAVSKGHAMFWSLYGATKLCEADPKEGAAWQQSRSH